MSDSEFIKIFKELPNSCEVCIRYKRTEPRPIVGFSLGTHFNESIAMDIKEINGNKALHLIGHAKNTLHNVHGYSPNQLVFGRNPNLPGLLNDKLPALEGVSTSEVVADNLNVMHGARKQFIACESLEKVRRALCHQVRTSIAQTYKNADAVLYKRNLCDRWLGPGTVIAWEHKQVLVKHGGTYVRVYPFRLVPYLETYQSFSEDSKNEPNTSQKRPDESQKVLFTNPSARAGYDTRSIFKWSLTGFEFRVFLLLD